MNTKFIDVKARYNAPELEFYALAEEAICATSFNGSTIDVVTVDDWGTL